MLLLKFTISTSQELDISFLKKNRDETVNNNLARKYDFRKLWQNFEDFFYFRLKSINAQSGRRISCYERNSIKERERKKKQKYKKRKKFEKTHADTAGTPLICELDNFGFRDSRVSAAHVLSSVFVFLKTWLTESSLAPSHVPSVERQQVGSGQSRKIERTHLRFGLADDCTMPMGERLSEDNSITIVPLHCYSPPVRAGDSPLESFSWISRSITEGFWGESRLPAMRPKYGVRIPELAHTKIASNCGLTRYFLVFARRHWFLCYTENVRSSREIIRTTGILELLFSRY